MNYRTDKYGNELSILGFGCMRFPQSGGRTDIAATERLIRSAVAAGVNYFDTAYIYTGSEAALGEILEKNDLRDKVYIASKLPHYLIRSRDGIEKLFQEELKRLRTDHIDYYLMHMLTDTSAWERMKTLGIEDWLAEKQRSGAIGQVGFSYHGGTEMFCRLLDARDWDFCMIQYNYMDEHSQAGRKGLEYAREKGLPVMVMEPLRGGKLANNLPKEAEAIFSAQQTRRSPAEWSFRWLWDQPEITVVLSGMNNLQMLRENCAAASEAEAGAFTGAEREMLYGVAAAINAKMKVGCTGCRYCMPCPKGVDIPGVFSAYNRLYSEGRFAGLREYVMGTALRRDGSGASNCIGCGKCEQHCPQHIAIREELKNVKKSMEGLPYKAVRAAVKALKIYG